MDKAIRYVKLRNPIPINDLPLQKIFWDRRLVLAILDRIGVPTPSRIELNRDGGPRLDPEVAREVKERFGIDLNLPRKTPQSIEVVNDSALIVDGKRIEKPFVEKPVSGEDHNINIYFGYGNGGRKLFRKIANQSSVLDPDLRTPRTDGSYIYEQFMKTDNSEDIKIYTLGPDIVHAETRKSPVVDGIVKRNLDGKEIRYIVELNSEERQIARKISKAFSQNVCGFDILRVKGKSFVIDVNGWSFVKGNDSYYDKCADTLAKFCLNSMPSINVLTKTLGDGKGGLGLGMGIGGEPLSFKKPTVGSWKLKAMISVFRHADRTPKNKLKFNFSADEAGSKPFIKLLQGRKDEIILRTEPHLKLIETATKESIHTEGSDQVKLRRLLLILSSKIGKQGLKAQLKPSFLEASKKKTKTADKKLSGGDGADHKNDNSTICDQKDNDKTLDELDDGKVDKRNKVVKEDNEEGSVLEKITIVVKWGGEFTHSARYQSRDIAVNFAKDLKVMSKTMLDDVTIFTSSESRVVATAEIFSAGLIEACKTHSKTEPKKIPLIIRKDLLDDSNAAKELMDRVKKRLKVLLRHNQGIEVNWPIPDKEPFDVVQEVISILMQQRDLMNRNFEDIEVDKIQSRWCCGECPMLFKERWDKLFSDWCDGSLDPSRVCELYDSLKYDSLHNRTFLETIFSDPKAWSPCPSEDSSPLAMPGSAHPLMPPSPSFSTPSHFRSRTASGIGISNNENRSPARSSTPSHSLNHSRAPSNRYSASISDNISCKDDETNRPNERESIVRLRKLYRYAKVLFDLIAPQEYGIEKSEKRKIGLLTSLPLLQKILSDIKEARNSEGGLARFYFTKESHMHTLVNLIKTSSLKLAHRDVMELDYMAYISFEVHERIIETGKKEYSMRISLSEGAHGIPLDTSLDAKHALQVIPRRQLIPHTDLDEVIETLEDWGDGVFEIKRSTTPFDGFLPVEGEDVF
ncbi:histidine phosphatase superfamily-domain-containing protein [Phakopsora pachyrhizi]|nr:histidine phosphatase superfamily-domain-containing protein [Phakopsora pachyrhizi]